MNAPNNLDDYLRLGRRLIERNKQGVTKMSGRCSSIRLGETVFPLWAASKEIYSSSSAKYSKFKLSHADFAEHLLRFHIENSCSLCCAESYIGKYRNIGIQTEDESSYDQHQTKDTTDPKQTWNEKPAKLHFDHAYFTMDTTRMKNSKKPSRKRCLSLFPLQDVPPDANDDGRDVSGDEDDDTTVTASERGSEEDISLFPMNFSKFVPVEEKMVSQCAADDLVRQEERRVQKQRDSVEGIISKIKQKILGEEVIGDKRGVCDAVAAGREGEATADNVCVLSKMKTGIIREEDEEDFITALYTMAAGNDVQCLAKMTDQPQMYPAQGVVKTITQDVGISESKTMDAIGECQMMKEKTNSRSSVDMVCKEEGCKQLREGGAGRSRTKVAKVAIGLTNLPSIDRRQLMKTQRMLRRKAKKKVLETKKEKKKPIPKVPEQKIYRPHPRLDVQLAKLPKMYECKTCFIQLPEVDSMRSHYAAAHPKETASRGRHQMPDAVTASSLFPVLEFKRIATELRQCKECKEYVDNIKVHRRVHWVKRFVCDICGKGFVFKSILRKHQMYHNAQWRLFKTHKCSVCGKAYIDKTSLNAHVLSSHNQGEKCFICEQCGKQFARKKSLAVHSDTHLKEKPFRCFECGRGFTQKNNMKLHMRTHTGVKPYRCNSCSKDFRHKVSLKTHQKKAHGIDWWKEREREKSDSEVLNLGSQQPEQQK
ncbi:uncharacterized protein [Asterias amurensis]|uniref:uncharacterized protein n=1 Tax=Asterias amurensis TaxID=7602 RepID=UPI003AB68C7A